MEARTRRLTRVRGAAFALVAAGCSAGAAAAWIPVRGRVPAVDSALVLVVIVAATGLAGRRPAVACAAGAAAVAFDAFDTAPYGTLAIARSADLITTVMLFVVGVAGGELVMRLVRVRRLSAQDAERLGQIGNAASLVAHGEEAVLILAGVGREVSRLLQLRGCTFGAGEAPPDTPEITRDGELSPGGTAALSLPVWASGRRVGHFLLDPSAASPLDPASLRVAVTLADQAGAALAVYEPPAGAPAPPDGGGPPGAGAPGGPAVAPAGRHLRLLH